MSALTVQVPVLMSKAQQTRLARKARASKLTMGELLRQAGERFDPEEDIALLERLAQHVTQTTTKAIRAIDQTLSLVAASERRIERLTRSTRQKPDHGTH
jgi:hypothetical protein